MNNIDKIQELKERYRCSFIEKSEQINEYLISLSSDEESQNEKERVHNTVCIEAHEFLHKLAGSSGMYDYEDIALLSRKAMSSSRDRDSELLIEQLTELHDLLKQHAKEVGL